MADSELYFFFSSRPTESFTLEVSKNEDKGNQQRQRSLIYLCKSLLWWNDVSSHLCWRVSWMTLWAYVWVTSLMFCHLNAPAHSYNMRWALLTSMEKNSEWVNPARDILAERASVRVGERVGSWPALGLYSPVIFNHPPLAYYRVSPPVHSGSTFGSVSCSRAARFKQNQRMIALSPCNNPFFFFLRKKEEGGGWGGAEMVYRQGWHALWMWHSKSWL